MSGLNTRRILGGGILAGAIMLVAHGLAEVFMRSEMERMFARLSLAQPGESAMLVLAVIAVVVGIIGVCLYAVLLPRFGAGLGTALRAGVTIWELNCLLPYLGLLAYGVLDGRLFVLFALSDLLVVPLAIVAGSAVYREQGTAEARLRAAPVRA
jgi:hypothetical protein